MRQRGKYALNLPAPLSGTEDDLRIGSIVDHIRNVLGHWNNAAFAAEDLQDHVVAYRVYEGAQTFRMGDAIAPYDQQHAQKCLLPDLLDQLRRPHAVAQLNVQKPAKIRSEVPLSFRIAVPQPLKILLVEGGNFQCILSVFFMLVQSYTTEPVERVPSQSMRLMGAGYPTSRLINRLVVENLKHRPIRTLLSILAIAIQVTMVLTLVGVSTGMLHEQVKRSRGIGADIVVRAPQSSLLTLSAGNLNPRFVPFIEKVPHVTAATGVLLAQNGFLTTVTGVDLAGLDRISGGFRYLRGGPFQGPDDIIIDDYYAKENKLHVGSAVTILNQSWRVSGIVEPGILARFVVPIETLQKLTSNSNKLSAIYVKVDRPENIRAVVDNLKHRMPDYGITPMEELISQISVTNIPMLREFINVVIGLGVLIGFLVVFLSMYTAVLERTREIGVLKALGASPVYIINIILRETFLLAVCGSIIGIGLSYFTEWIINSVIHGSLIQAIVYVWWAYAAAIAIVGALLGASYPGLKAARQNAIEALAYE